LSRTKYTPDFIIIGAQRCGTTSLYNHLIRDTHIAPALQKEVHFFDINYGKGFDWYRAQFPYLDKDMVVTGEASPYYLFHPHSPKRIFERIPSVRLIALLRNPVDRAYSHYHHEFRRGIETLSFEDAIKKEEERLDGEIEKMLNDENYYSFSHQHYSYLSRGVYVDQLKAWTSLFPMEQMLVIKSEDLYNNSSFVIEQVIDFVKSPTRNHSTVLKRVVESIKVLGRGNGFKNYNNAHYPPMNSSLRKRLTDYFTPHNQRLYDHLNTNFEWID